MTWKLIIYYLFVGFDYYEKANETSQDAAGIYVDRTACSYSDYRFINWHPYAVIKSP